MSESAYSDENEKLREHPDYHKAKRAYSAEEDYRVRIALLRQFDGRLLEDVETTIEEIVEDSQEMKTPDGSIGWLYSYKGKRLLIGLLHFTPGKLGVGYGFQDC